jgi:tetratricopeptide (TPR) repeat protein
MLKNSFTNWDDDYYVVNNALLRGPDWAGIFSQPVVSNYHPLTVISLAGNYAISGTEPWSYLLFNLLLHLINTVLVFYFIYAISDKKISVALLTALLFGIHPMHVESVAWVSERKDVLYTLFFLLSLMQYWKYLQTGKQKNLWICFLLFVFSLLSKPAAIILPLVLFLLDYWKQRPFHKKLILEKVPFFLAAGLFTVITLKLQSVTAMTSLDVYPLWVRLLFACYVAMIYFFRFFIPYPLSAFHPFPPPGDLGWPVYLAPLFIVGLLLFIWRFRKNRLVVFGSFFFLINLALVLQIISIGFTIVSERYTYIPYIGIAFISAMLIEKYFAAKNKFAWTITSLVLIVFCFLSFKRTRVWKDSNSLWTDVISHYPKTSMPRGERAQFNYNKAITMDPAKATSLYQRIIEDCTVAVNNNPDSSKQEVKRGGGSMYNMRGTSFYYLKQYENAMRDFNKSVAIDPYDDHIINFRGTIFFNYYKNYDKALSDFTKAININPQTDYYLNRSRCYYMLGDLPKARQDVQAAIAKGAVVTEEYRKLLNM